MDIRSWLAGLGLDRYSENLERNDIDIDLLRTLSDSDLKELGVDSLGARRKIIAAIAPQSPPDIIAGQKIFVASSLAVPNGDLGTDPSVGQTMFVGIAPAPVLSAPSSPSAEMTSDGLPCEGDVLGGRYNLLSELGRGAMGAVFRAWDTKLRHDCAVKVILPALLSQPGVRDLFLREAKCALRLSHPHLLRVNTLEDAPFDYLVMEYVDGGNLTDRWQQQRKRLAPADVRQLMIQVLEGLAYLHNEGLVHRDIKPDNVLLTRDGKVKLADYGVSTSIRAVRSTEQTAGTLAYMSPEQLRGDRYLDGRSDLFSLGLMAHQLLLGRLPFDTHAEAIKAWHRSDERDLDDLARAPWGGIFADALALDPDERWQSAAMMAEALKATADGTRPEGGPVGRTRTARATSRSEHTENKRPMWFRDTGQDSFGKWVTAVIAGVDVRFRWCAPGRFTMGSPVSEEGRWDVEGPQHDVKFRLGFWLAEVPVTQALWSAVMHSNPSRFKAHDRPVEQVSWDDCQHFLAKASDPAELALRLPTEAEWEYACRAGTSGPSWLGTSDPAALAAIAWTSDNSGEETHPVAGKEPNPWGMFDMLGNVFEWTSDWYGPYADDPVIDPRGPEHGTERVRRGGAWSGGPGKARAAFRFANGPIARFDYLGFRLARSP